MFPTRNPWKRHFTNEVLPQIENDELRMKFFRRARGRKSWFYHLKYLLFGVDYEKNGYKKILSYF